MKPAVPGIDSPLGSFSLSFCAFGYAGSGKSSMPSPSALSPLPYMYSCRRAKRKHESGGYAPFLSVSLGRCAPNTHRFYRVAPFLLTPTKSVGS
jgi:hypothetical protein